MRPGRRSGSAQEISKPKVILKSHGRGIMNVLPGKEILIWSALDWLQAEKKRLLRHKSILQPTTNNQRTATGSAREYVLSSLLTEGEAFAKRIERTNRRPSEKETGVTALCACSPLMTGRRRAGCATFFPNLQYNEEGPEYSAVASLSLCS